jgi:homoserine dehydrogenase
VRDPARQRRAPRVARVTTNVEAFLRGRYDVVIDALPGRDAAADVVARVLGRGVPVVSANKALIAAEGPRLRRIAARAGTTLRVEAAVMAGVPFLGTLERRPLAGSATRFTGVLNATSHFIVTRVAAGERFDDALDEARQRGYAEPDPSADLQSRDARDKLIVLADLLLEAALEPGAIPIDAITDLTPRDFHAAARLGGVLKPVARAERVRAGVAAFAGPAWLPAAHPLAATSGRENGILIEGRHIDRLFFAGAGAGPDVTAATLLDDAVEAVRNQGRPLHERPVSAPADVAVAETGWFVRVPAASACARAAFNTCDPRPASHEDAGTTWLLLAATPQSRVEEACARLRYAGTPARAWRAIHD